MRNDQALREYFDGCLAFLKKNPTARFYESAFHPTDGISNGSSPTLTRHSSGFPPAGSAAAMSNPNTAVAHVTIVRKLTELHELVEKRREVIHELESAHVILARTVMQAVGDRVRRRAHQSNLREKVLHRKEKGSTEALDELVEALGEFLPVDKLEYTLWQQMHPEKRSASLLPSRTIWEALADLSPELLDPYQPITKLKVFRGQVAPSIDYYLTKLNLLTVSHPDLTRIDSRLRLIKHIITVPRRRAPRSSRFVCRLRHRLRDLLLRKRRPAHQARAELDPRSRTLLPSPVCARYARPRLEQARASQFSRRCSPRLHRPRSSLGRYDHLDSSNGSPSRSGLA